MKKLTKKQTYNFSQKIYGYEMTGIRNGMCCLEGTDCLCISDPKQWCFYVDPYYGKFCGGTLCEW